MNPTSGIAPTEAEILQHLIDIKETDLFGHQAQTILAFLSFDAAKPYLHEDVTLTDWESIQIPADQTRAGAIGKMQGYISFAIDKAINHRGLSAIRSIDHFKGWTWLAGDYDKIDWTRYQNYGAPILAQIINLYSFSITPEAEFWSMSKGERCKPDCREGCSA